MAVVWSSEGADDFLSALTYLRGRNRPAAEMLSRRVDEALQRLDELPINGPAAQLGEGMVVCSWPVQPFRVYYQRGGHDLLVVRLYDQRREPIERR